jgi:thiamine-phosphate pyrophosphorylase
LFPALYSILDPNLITGPSLPLAAALADAGVQLIQLRDKSGSAARICAESRALVAALSSRGVRLIVNDRPDVAAMAGAGGVHVGQEDLPVEDARRICGSSCWVGVSTHNLDQLQEADRSSADYIAVGPVFATNTKENPDPVVGIDFLRKARQLTRKPLVAIGGITIDSAAEVYLAGADAVAVARDLLSADDPPGRARQYLATANRIRSICD